MEYICKHCNKVYKSIQSRSNHYRIYHKIGSKPQVSLRSVKSKPKVSLIDIPIINITFICKYCNNIYKHKQSKHKHEKICNNKTKNNNSDIIIDELKKQNEELNNKLTELLKYCKIHPKTLQKINKQLINNNINNGTINNTINIIKFGTEDINNILSQSEILKILNKKMLSLEESIKMIHFNDKRPEFKNIYITNLKDQYAYIYDGSKFIAVLKSDVLEELANNHFENIEFSVDEYKEKINEKTLIVLDKFIEKMNDDDEFIDKEHHKIYPNFKSYKINQIKLMIYNESDKKTNIVNVICDKNELPLLHSDI